MADKTSAGQMMAVMGTMLMLCRTSRLHSAYRVAQLVDRVWPSITRGHYCLYTEEGSGKPVGFCNWIMVSQDILDQFLEHNREVEPADWDSGDIPFFPEMIAPFGHMRRIAGDLRSHTMAGIPWGYALRGVHMNEDGTVPAQRVVKLKGRPSDADNHSEKPRSTLRILKT